MLILALDSSTQWLSVAVYDGRKATVIRERAGQAASERILPMTTRVLADAGTTLGALGGIAFGAGPGAFTGVRITCGVVQGLALGARLPVYGVPTLGAMAHSAGTAHGWMRVAACLDARMGEVYAGFYERVDGRWTAVRPIVACNPLALDAPDSSSWNGAGDGFERHPALATRLALGAVDAAIAPDAAAIAQWAFPHLLAGEGVDAGSAQPLYVRDRVALTTAERADGVRL
ncbi:MAG: tRNA (adenosine(37)-N6)-threonylcarbamoyltransferase complex dimerization subunit type 1 TsaB [Betaproteobacteria bacterium]